MLVNNDWKIDSRVRREATALAAAGHRVDVIFRGGQVPGATDTSEGVTYHAVPQVSALHPWRQLLRRLMLHAGVVRAAWNAPGSRVEWLRGAGIALALLLPGLVLLALALLLLPLAVVGVLLVTLAGPRDARRRILYYTARALAPVGRRLNQLDTLEFLHYLDSIGVHGKAIGLGLAPTVVHSHDLTTLSTGYAIARRLGVPLLYDAHELETHTNYWTLAPLTKHWIAMYENILIRRTRAVITVCDSIADWLKENYAIERPTVVLNSPDLQPADDRPKRTVRDHLGLAPGTPLAVYVGSVTIDRGATHCVEAAALVPGLHFAFVGPRYSVTEGEIVECAERLGIRDRIHLVDPVPSREVTSFVSSADCSVIAIQNVCLSYYFCFPNKLLESVVSGVPVAVARLVELERFVGRFRVGVVMDEKDPASIADAIRQIVADPARFRPSTQTLQTIRDEYGWPAQKQRLGHLYSALA
ncbi:glycosyltransferase family 4 protein [Ramlibacter sp. AN1133]|uniref:glycosyltransferase family 4 protein n=1 Tax=Ramlibacter sp. AN1133 TaxID=3133429 RepID=UPI0030C5AF0C